MGGYKPLYIAGNATGLVQERQQFILPNDAYPILQNAFVWREQIRRKQGYTLLGRLRRNLTAAAMGNISAGGAGTVTVNIFTGLGLTNEPQAEIQVGSQQTIVITIGAPISQTLTDTLGLGALVVTGAGPIVSATINYATGALTMVFSGAAGVSAATFTGAYYPTLPTMGIRSRDLSPINNELTVFFDTKYAYNFSATGFVEFIPGTTWSAGLPNANSNFFWTTNYWVSPGATGKKIFWATNFSGSTGDPIRYTNGTGGGTGVWIDFAPKINVANDVLAQCLCLLPFRGRLVAFNTLEGANLATSVAYPNRIRWAEIGNPIADISTIFPGVGDVVATAWRDDIRGKGGFLDIPTNEDIISVGFVRDNLVIYCENSTWQLRYTGRSIAPFQIEKVNTELGSGSTFSAVQFDTTLVGVGDKGIVECDSFKSYKIDVKIPDLVMNHFNNSNNGHKRIHGARDFLQRMAYWTYPETDSNGTFPDRRLAYNYENDSWAIFTDSLTTMGTFQPVSNRTWANPTGGLPSTKLSWGEANFSWGDRPAAILSLVGGNQQGYIEYLDSQDTNDPSLTIQSITANTTSPTQIGSVDHNLKTGAVISISDIPIGTAFASSLNNPKSGPITNSTQANPCQITSPLHSLVTGDRVSISGVVGMTQLNGFVYEITVTSVNDFTLNDVDSTLFTAYASGGVWTNQSRNVFGIVVNSANTFLLMKYDPDTREFSDPQLDPVPVVPYVGGAEISVRDNFRVVSKKFNFLEEAQNIQIGFIDLLVNESGDGHMTLNVYVNYDDNTAVNAFPENTDPAFNSVISTHDAEFSDSSKFNTRVFCAVRGNYITVEYTFSNAQMASSDQERDVQIDMQVIWMRPAGRIGNS